MADFMDVLGFSYAPAYTSITAVYDNFACHNRNRFHQKLYYHLKHALSTAEL